VWSEADKNRVRQGLLAVGRECRKRSELKRMTMIDWLHEKKQARQAIRYREVASKVRKAEATRRFSRAERP